MKDYQIAKLTCLLMGQEVICSDEDLNTFANLEECPEILSLPNPDRVGTKDTYVCIAYQGPNRLALAANFRDKYKR